MRYRLSAIRTMILLGSRFRCDQARFGIFAGSSKCGVWADGVGGRVVRGAEETPQQGPLEAVVVGVAGDASEVSHPASPGGEPLRVRVRGASLRRKQSAGGPAAAVSRAGQRHCNSTVKR